MSNTVSESLDVNPFVGEGGAYDSVRPAYPDEAVAASADSVESAESADSEASVPSEAARSWEASESAAPLSERDRSTSADCASPRMS